MSGREKETELNAQRPTPDTQVRIKDIFICVVLVSVCHMGLGLKRVCRLSRVKGTAIWPLCCVPASGADQESSAACGALHRNQPAVPLPLHREPTNVSPGLPGRLTPIYSEHFMSGLP